MVSRLRPATLWGRPLQTRFRSGSAAEPLNLAADRKSPDHYAKGTPSGIPQKQTANSRQGTMDQPVFAGPHRLWGDRLPRNLKGRMLRALRAAVYCVLSTSGA